MGGLQDLLRALPAVDRVLREEPLRSLLEYLPQEILTRAVKEQLEQVRKHLIADSRNSCPSQLQPQVIALKAATACRRFTSPSLRKVINATGTLLHTNLGRAPLAAPALRAVEDVARGYSALEIDMESGDRGERSDHVEALLQQLTGAEAALVVNNNAGAVLLALTALARGREALVSRGELVEIGGGFRIPEVMEAGGVRLREVGSTNRTYRQDYARAISDDTAILLKVHTSNYQIVGFSERVSSFELAALAQANNLIAMEDLGSGLLLDLSCHGLPTEPVVSEVVASGMDIVTFSGDKLLGGPQAGLIVGRRELISLLKKHPLARALRIDKLSLAALEATLRLYLTPRLAHEQIPVLAMLATDPDHQRQRCQALFARIGAEQLPVDMKVVDDISRVGGGSMPLAELKGYAVAIRSHLTSVDNLTRRLRQMVPAVIGRIRNDSLLINLRTVLPADDALLAQLLVTALQEEDGC